MVVANMVFESVSGSFPITCDKGFKNATMLLYRLQGRTVVECFPLKEPFKVLAMPIKKVSDKWVLRLFDEVRMQPCVRLRSLA